jgi:ABC-2 type transport system permease protein
MLQVLFKEFNSFLNSLIAYVVIGVFLMAMGLLMWVFPDTSVLDYGYADMETLFSLGPYVFIFLIPAITMRSFAEEKKSGTMELLFTKPVTDLDVICGKFMACYLLVLVSLIPTLVYYYTLHALGSPPGNVDTPGIAGSYIGLLCLAATFTAAGVFASAMTPNQIVAFVLAAFLCFILFTGFESLADLSFWSGDGLLVKQLGILYHYESMSRGLIDLRDIIYFASAVVFLLLATKTILASRLW